jgi:sugar lactone lactonase YvrE
VAAFDGCELEDWEADDAGKADEGDDVDGAAVDAKERVVLSSAQNCLARFSAEGTLELQLDATQL